MFIPFHSNPKRCNEKHGWTKSKDKAHNGCKVENYTPEIQGYFRQK
jgi:hypothetical protein